MDKGIVGWILFVWGLLGLLGNTVVMVVWRFAPTALIANSGFCLLLMWGGWRLSHPATAKLVKKEQTTVAERPSSLSGTSHPQPGGTPSGDTLKREPQQAKCPFCASTTFRVVEESGQRRCSDCHTVLPRYIQGNR